MGNDQISQILMYLLIFMVIILFILLFVFINIKMKMKKRSKETGIRQDKEEEKIKTSKDLSVGKILDFMEFEKIEDNMIIQKEKKKYVMVIECKGVNYDLMSGIEKTGVEEGFLQFLNTLKYPVQLYIQTRSINLEKSIENYKEKLKKIEIDYNRKKVQYNEIIKSPTITDKQKQKAFFEVTKISNLYEYTKDIIRDTEKMSLNKNILNKKYYVAVAYYQEDDLNSELKYDVEEIRNIAFSDLYTKSQAIIRTLSSCGVNGKILNSIQLAELLYMAYNREGAEAFGIERALKAGYDQLYSTAPDVLDKKIVELDKEVEKQATIMAREKILQAKTEKEIEIEQREKNMDKLIDDMAKIILEENKEYIGEDISKRAVEKVEQESKEKEAIANEKK